MTELGVDNIFDGVLKRPFYEIFITKEVVTTT